MSASLVGSEMCIRDRQQTEGGAEGVSGHSARCPAACSTHGLPALSPVSYTHLTLPTICSV
eukprot:7080386-Alexandrium_andersonii.AAC.1